MSENKETDQQEISEEEFEQNNAAEEAVEELSDDKLVAVLEENEKLKEQMMYFVAENENFRKRSTKQVEDAGKFAVTKFAKDLIDVLENLYLATANVSEDLLKENEAVNAIFQGVEMTKTSMLNVFAKHGIKRIFPKEGEAFDHNFHEAVSYIEQEGFEDNSIVNVMRAGYLLNDRLLKPAVVVLAKTAK
jgi:molecular chaperone GrpE